MLLLFFKIRQSFFVTRALRLVNKTFSWKKTWKWFTKVHATVFSFVVVVNPPKLCFKTKVFFWRERRGLRPLPNLLERVNLDNKLNKNTKDKKYITRIVIVHFCDEKKTYLTTLVEFYWGQLRRSITTNINKETSTSFSILFKRKVQIIRGIIWVR